MMDSAQFPVENVSSPKQVVSSDIEMKNKVKKTTEKISENLHIVANEPSLACYRLQEHIQKSLPQIVTKRIEVNQLQRDLQGKCYDLEYSINALKSMHRSKEYFTSVRDLIVNSIQIKQHLNQLEIPPKQEKKKKMKTSMYQRFSGSFDLPSSFLPAGLSSSASASADLKSSPQTLLTQKSPGGRRSRASSVSSNPSHSAVIRTQSATSTSKKNVSASPSKLSREHSVS